MPDVPDDVLDRCLRELTTLYRSLEEAQAALRVRHFSACLHQIEAARFRLWQLMQALDRNGATPVRGLLSVQKVPDAYQNTPATRHLLDSLRIAREVAVVTDSERGFHDDLAAVLDSLIVSIESSRDQAADARTPMP